MNERPEAVVQTAEEQTPCGIMKTLGELPPGTILQEEAVARMFGRHPVTVKRAVDRRELPPPVRMFGKPCWTAGVILAHLSARLEAAGREAEKEAARIARLSPYISRNARYTLLNGEEMQTTTRTQAETTRREVGSRDAGASSPVGVGCAEGRRQGGGVVPVVLPIGLLEEKKGLNMAGVRSTPNRKGKYQGWYLNHTGRRVFFTGTHKETETLRTAQRLEDEHRQIRLGYRPVPKSADKHRATPIQEVIDQYLAWGKSQGGRNGYAWSAEHHRKRTDSLARWVKQLGLGVLADLDGILPRVESALRALQEAGKTGKTLQIYREALGAFCRWAVTRGYLLDDPLKGSVPFDTTPKTVRRAMSVDEIQLLLSKCSPQHRLLYEVAFSSGLRASELRALRLKHLDVAGRGIILDASWTKSRKAGISTPGRSPCDTVGRGVRREVRR